MPNKRRSAHHAPTQKTAPPYTLFVHSLAAMGDERYAEAITALEKYLTLESNPLDRAKGLQTRQERRKRCRGALLRHRDS
jgi:hypothetical protein